MEGVGEENKFEFFLTEEKYNDAPHRQEANEERRNHMLPFRPDDIRRSQHLHRRLILKSNFRCQVGSGALRLKPLSIVINHFSTLQRSDIFVQSTMGKISSSVRSGTFRRDGAGEFGGQGFYKDVVPDGAFGRSAGRRCFSSTW